VRYNHTSAAANGQRSRPGLLDSKPAPFQKVAPATYRFRRAAPEGRSLPPQYPLAPFRGSLKLQPAKLLFSISAGPKNDSYIVAQAQCLLHNTQQEASECREKVPGHPQTEDTELAPHPGEHPKFPVSGEGGASSSVRAIGALSVLQVSSHIEESTVYFLHG
jgi:hypothetical protein